MIKLISVIVLIGIIGFSLVNQYVNENKDKEKKTQKNRRIGKEKNKEANKEVDVKNSKKENKEKYSNSEENINNVTKLSRIDEFCNKHYKKIWIVFAVIIFITVIYKFGEIPTYVGVDEAGMAYDAYCLAEYGTDRYMNSFPLYLTNFGGGQSSLCAYLVALCIKLFGANMIAYRLPTLLIYLMSVVVSYLLISKAKNKKTALLFTFLIIICPWNIANARMALDCNLFAGLFMLDLYLMNKAEKNYQYFIAGISVGITLYTYCLSWITIPIFLLVWAIYMLYIKKIKFGQLIVLGIPIAIFAAPLIYFLLLNYGIVDQTQLGIFTLPILPEFRAGEIGISNIINTSLESLKTIFISDETIYLIYVPLFIIGYIIEFKNAIQEVKKKEYGISALMVIAFTTILLGLLMTKIPTANKANVLFIPILYFVTIAILAITKDSKVILSIFILTILMLWVNFEYYYYMVDGVSNENWYEDIYLMDITNKIESDEELKEKQKYVLAYKSSPHIYTLLEMKMSPEEYMNTVEINYYGENIQRVRKVGNYNYLNIASEFDAIDLENDYVFIITNIYKKQINILLENGYKLEEYGDYCILTK